MAGASWLGVNGRISERERLRKGERVREAKSGVWGRQRESEREREREKENVTESSRRSGKRGIERALGRQAREERDAD